MGLSWGLMLIVCFRLGPWFTEVQALGWRRCIAMAALVLALGITLQILLVVAGMGITILGRGAFMAPVDGPPRWVVAALLFSWVEIFRMLSLVYTGLVAVAFLHAPIRTPSASGASGT